MLFPEITNSPFEVSENGWGEFEAGIRIYFVDADEQPIDLFHTIQLYPIGVSNPLNQKKVSFLKELVICFNVIAIFHILFLAGSCRALR